LFRRHGQLLQNASVRHVQSASVRLMQSQNLYERAWLGQSQNLYEWAMPATAIPYIHPAS